MSAETTIRVPYKLKVDLNGLKNKHDLYANTQHEVIRKLITYYHRSKKELTNLREAHEKQVREMKDSHAREIQKLESWAVTVIEAGEVKNTFIEVKDDLGLKTDQAVLEFLIENYRGSLQLGMGAFETYKRLRGQGK